ncbi:MAG: alpha-L-fucosidase [Ignavibacteria bacterium]|nr:alpha-L-fucosidase [Ignavibacteria bacterium]
MDKLVRSGILVLAMTFAVLAVGFAQDESAKDRRMQWFRDARFGLFIHWGIYSIPAGEWKGKEYPGAAEWIMYRAEIPVKECEALAPQFDPLQFNTEEWVRLAKDAGMKYVVITSKHHDGFAMYHSKASPYNIVDVTPFKRDPMKELAEACKKYGLRFCFYYSQTQDWHEPNGVGNYWDFDGESPKSFQQYFEKKAKPQVREILMNYGPIGLIWFDTPRNMTAAQSKELANLVHQLQPDCLVDGRIGNDMGDYKTKGDNKIPTGATDMDWETPATMNRSWGFKKSDNDWKSAKQLIRVLVEVTAKGGNYLLNVGPTAEGTIPTASVERLKVVGEWLKANGESVYGTSLSPWTILPEWGMITVKPGKVYLHVFEWPKEGKLELHGLNNHIGKVSILKHGSNLRFQQSKNEGQGVSSVSIEIPAVPIDSLVWVIALDVDGALNVNDRVHQEQSGTIDLFGITAEIHKSTGSKIKRNDTGIRVG